MKSFIITESGLEKNARKLMEEFYESIHEDYERNCFPENKKQREYYDDNVVDIYKKIVLGSNNRRMMKSDSCVSIVDISILPEVLLEGKKEMTKDEIKEYIKDEILKKTINPEFVFEFLSEMDEKLQSEIDSCIEFEINEDLYCLKKAFLKAYDLFHHSGYNLED